MKTIISKLFAISLMWTLLASVMVTFAQGDPTNMLQSVADQMIAKLKSNQATLKTKPSLVYSFAYQLIVPKADLAEMSKRVLPPQTWNSASASQRSRFQHEFTTLLVRTYATALSDYKDETVKFYPVRGGYAGKASVKVDSEIIRDDGPSIPVSYKLVAAGGQWKLYDMIVNGVSMLESFRSQFSSQLSQGNMDALIQTLSAHNNRRGG